MGSRRLEEIQAAIERLADAKTTGLETEVAAAWDALGARLPGNVKQEDALSVRQAQAATAAELMATQTLFAGSAKNVEAGFSSVRDGLEALGISDDQADAAVDAALGIAVQAGQFFLHPETYTVVQGRQVGQLTEAMVRLVSVLQPGEEINPAAIAERLKVKPNSASHLLGRTREASGDSLIELAGKGRYRRNPALTILGEEPSAPIPATVAPSAEAGPPVAFPMREILQQPGISGVLSEPQVRHLTRKLVASGHFQVGKHVVETKPQPRGKAKKIVWDLEATEVGVDALRSVAEKFGAQGRISLEDVRRELSGEVITREDTGAASGGWVYGNRVIDATGVTRGALLAMEELGILQSGIDVTVTPGGKRVYGASAFEKARRLEEKRKKMGQGTFTEELIVDAFGREKKKEQVDEWENPYGPNGPSILTSEHERILLDRLQKCESGIEAKLGRPLNQKFKIERDHRLGELTNRLAEDESLRIDSDVQQRIRREAAAAVLELARDARKFNFVRRQHPGLELTLMVIKALDKRSVADLAEAMVNPPTNVANVIDRNGVVNSIVRVGRLA